MKISSLLSEEEKKNYAGMKLKNASEEYLTTKAT